VHYHRIGDVLRKACVISGKIICTIHTIAPIVNPIKPAEDSRSVIGVRQNASAKAYTAARGHGELRKDALSGRATAGNSFYGWTEFRRRNHMSVI
jgi:hypothetical protein